jgi:diguanylate cyclase (GGDEF)-like protein/PAS domain S-box-containing protein
LPDDLDQLRLKFLLRRYAGVLAVACTGCLLTWLAVRGEIRQGEQQLHVQLEWRAANEAARFQRSLERAVEVVDSVGSYFAASEQVITEAFNYFTRGALRNHPEFQALQWLPRVAASARPAFEAEFAQIKLDGHISELQADGRLVRAGERGEFFPVFYTEPLRDTEKVLGFDVASRPADKRALVQAGDSGTMSTSGLITLVQNGGRRAVVLYSPVYRRDLPDETAAQRRAALRGFSAGVLHIDQVLAAALRDAPPTGLDIHILDASADGGKQLLHHHVSRSRSAGQPAPTLDEARAGLHRTVTVNAPGRQWQLVFNPAPKLQAEFGSNRHVWTLLGGLLLTGLLSAYLLRRIQYAERMNEAQQSAQLGSWRFNAISRRAFWSDQEYRSLGYEPGGCMPGYAAFLAAVHPGDRPLVKEHIRALMAGERDVLELFLRVTHSDGSEHVVHERAVATRDSRGKVLSIAGTTQDVTERKQQEEGLRLSARLMDSMQEAMVITNPRGTILNVNPAFCAITSYAAEEVIGGNPRLWKSQHHDAEFYQAMWAELGANGYWRGEIWNRRKSGEAFPSWQTISAVFDDQGRRTHYVSVFSDISSLVQSREQLAHQAYHDPLTDLPNRLLFQDRLSHALARAERDGSQVAVLFLDLDRFKHVNDSLGHPAGDELIRAVARRLSETIRKEDTVARTGGDEFVMLLEELRDVQDAAHLADKLLRVLAEPHHIQGHELYITSSIGISLYPHDGESADILVRNADAAMYQAKSNGRKTYAFYTQDLTAMAAERLQIEADLRSALENHELTVHYQPQIDLAKGRCIGAEALVRWHHPTLGNLPPDRFIPIAEDSGLIIELGEQVLREACLQARRWLDAGIEFETIGVNVAGPQLQHSDFVAMVSRVLAETGLPAAHLDLEMTETFIMKNADVTFGLLNELRALGVKLSIDDFGTGYSSLAYLKRLPIDRIKLDRSFIKDLPGDEEDAAITRAVASLSISLGLRLVAEGVETAAQLQFLHDLGCHEVQGYFFGRPVPAAEFVWLTDLNPGQN